MMEERRAITINEPENHPYCKGNDGDNVGIECQFTSEVIAPIVVEGDPIGAVIIATKEPNVKMTNLRTKISRNCSSLPSKTNGTIEVGGGEMNTTLFYFIFAI